MAGLAKKIVSSMHGVYTGTCGNDKHLRHSSITRREHWSNQLAAVF